MNHPRRVLLTFQHNRPRGDTENDAEDVNVPAHIFARRRTDLVLLGASIWQRASCTPSRLNDTAFIYDCDSRLTYKHTEPIDAVPDDLPVQ
jgi:hypothetical protein